MAKVKCRSCDICGEMNAKDGFAFIYDIPDSLTRQIVYYRCVSLFGWTRVAYEVGGNNSPDGVRMIYNRFMDKL